MVIGCSETTEGLVGNDNHYQLVVQYSTRKVVKLTTLNVVSPVASISLLIGSDVHHFVFTVKCLDEGSCSFCSIHSFLCNCGDRMERLDKVRDAILSPLRRHQVRPSVLLIIITYSISVYYYY